MMTYMSTDIFCQCMLFADQGYMLIDSILHALVGQDQALPLEDLSKSIF